MLQDALVLEEILDEMALGLYPEAIFYRTNCARKRNL